MATSDVWVRAGTTPVRADTIQRIVWQADSGGLMLKGAGEREFLPVDVPPSAMPAADKAWQTDAAALAGRLLDAVATCADLPGIHRLVLDTCGGRVQWLREISAGHGYVRVPVDDWGGVVGQVRPDLIPPRSASAGGAALWPS